MDGSASCLPTGASGRKGISRGNFLASLQSPGSGRSDRTCRGADRQLAMDVMRRQETGTSTYACGKWGGEGHTVGANTEAPSAPHVRDVVHPMTTGISEGLHGHGCMAVLELE